MYIIRSSRYGQLSSATTLDNAIYWSKSYKKHDGQNEDITIWQNGIEIMEV